MPEAIAKLMVKSRAAAGVSSGEVCPMHLTLGNLRFNVVFLLVE